MRSAQIISGDCDPVAVRHAQNASEMAGRDGAVLPPTIHRDRRDVTLSRDIIATANLAQDGFYICDHAAIMTNLVTASRG